ncbi:MAG: dynamin family protein [Planctomycetota bacterium]
MPTPGTQIKERLDSLESNLKAENPVLVSVVQSFKELDQVAYAMGLLAREESYATQIPWWPMISVMGVFSAGKSSFVNHFLGRALQRTGNQAVDDKFTVICFSREQEVRTLPGVALDADPRFPFYQMSREIEKVAEGEGKRIDAYLQLKTCPSEQLRGKILIDSPGFDADAQRTSTLRITDHMIDLSDLVLVFFDARHPEPGAMRDTLEHLVLRTIRRPDSGKFLFILNQIDTTAREDNPEEVVAAWQRALADQGLTAGRFYCVYNPECAVPIEDASKRARFETKRDQDLSEIMERMKEVASSRAYRVVGTLEKTARQIEEQAVQIRSALRRWRKRVLWTDGILLVLILGALFAWSIKLEYWQGLIFSPPWLDSLKHRTWLQIVILVLVVALGVSLHYTVRNLAARRLAASALDRAIARNTRWWRSLFRTQAVGWRRSARRRVDKVLVDAKRYVQILNDHFTNPSGN